MASLTPGLTAAAYMTGGLLCLAAPYMLPKSAEEAFVWPNFLFTGVPLCLSGFLLAVVHAQHRLDQPRDRTTALVWVVGTWLMALPASFWGTAYRAYAVVLWVQATGVALAAVFLIGLARRIWAQRSRMRVFLSSGIAALALLFGWVTYQIISGIVVGYEGGLEGIVEQTLTFLVGMAIACALLIIGIVGQQFTRTRQGTASQAGSQGTSRGR